MKQFIIAAMMVLVSSMAYGQTRKGPVDVNFRFQHDGLQTDFYELCLTSETPLACERVDVTNDATEYKLTKTYTSGPFTVAVRACNAAGCSVLSNTVNTPIIVDRAPNAPTNLNVVIVITGE